MATWLVTTERSGRQHVDTIEAASAEVAADTVLAWLTDNERKMTTVVNVEPVETID